jgi:hypothetical protein
MFELPDIQNLAVNASQDQQLAHHKKHIQVLWKHIERLEQFIEVDTGGSVTIKVGNAAIVLKRNGEITIKGHDINIEGFGNVRLKAASSVVIKGDKILQN